MALFSQLTGAEGNVSDTDMQRPLPLDSNRKKPTCGPYSTLRAIPC